jgi:hypothetical protein
VNQHGPLWVQHEDVALTLAPAAGGGTEIAKRLFPFDADQLCSVFNQTRQFAGILILVRLIKKIYE